VIRASLTDESLTRTLLMMPLLRASESSDFMVHYKFIILTSVVISNVFNWWLTSQWLVDIARIEKSIVPAAVQYDFSPPPKVCAAADDVDK